MEEPFAHIHDVCVKKKNNLDQVLYQGQNALSHVQDNSHQWIITQKE